MKSYINRYIDNNKRQTDVCIVIASVDRHPHYYLSITLASVLKGLSQQERDRYNASVFVLDTEPDPNRNREAKNLVGKFPPHLFTVVPTKRNDRSLSWYEKEVLDYADALHFCASKKASMTIMLEDDTLATNHYVDKLMKAYRTIPANSDYMDIKLFYPEFYCGFTGMKDYIGFAIFAPLAGAFLTVIVMRVVLRGKLNKLTTVKILMWIYFSTLCVLIPLAIGRQNLFWCFKFGIHPFTATAFTNAVAYPAAKMEIVASFLETHMRDDPVDLLLDKFALDNKWMRYLLVPNLFQHIGIYSSNSYKNQGNDRWLKTSMTFVEH